MRTGSLFSGYGGLDLAVNDYFDADTAWVVENDPAPAAILAHHWPDTPNHGDVSQIDWDSLEPVDILTGGFPCQDVSAAGRRAGLTDGTRSGLWAHMAAAVGALRPAWVVIENVRGLHSARAHRPMESDPNGVGDSESRPVLRAAGAVLGDLADLGYDAQWITVAAADIGACHRRERVFIVAHAADPERQRRQRRQATQPGNPRPGHPSGQPHRSASPAADAPGDRRQQGRPEPAWLLGRSDAAQRRLLPTPGAADGAGGHLNSGTHQATLPGTVRDLLPTPLGRDHRGHSAAGRQGGAGLLNTVERLLPTPGAADVTGGGANPASRLAAGHHLQLIDAVLDDTIDGGQWGPYQAAIRRAEQACGRPAPEPTEPNRNGNPRLSARFAEWMQMLPAGWVTDPALGLSRADQLKAIGNGVCPPQAYRSLALLVPIAATVRGA